MKRLCNWLRTHVFAACMGLAAILLVTVALAVSIGPVMIPFSEVWRVLFHNLFGVGDISDIPVNTQNIVWHLRVPRVLMGALVGLSLTLSGIAMQSFTKNPLASPYVLGISSGASFGAVLAITTGALAFLGAYALQVGAFAGAMASILIVYGMAKSGRAVAPIKLVLVGMAVSALFSAFSNFLVYKAPVESKVKEVTFWMLGSIASAEWKDLIPLAVLAVPGSIVLYALSNSLNALLMGESSAITLGVSVNAVRTVTVFLSAILTGAAVASSGCIGFIGLVVLHITRAVVGADHRKVIPIASFLGTIFLIWVDVGARMLDIPSEIPIGIITAMVGAPFFLWMMKARRYAFGGSS